MGNRALPLALLTLVLGGACARHAPVAPTPATMRVVGYYFGPTVNRGFPVSKINGDLLTHINYAFGEIRDDGIARLANPAIDTLNFQEIRRLKQRFPHLRVLISFGGWTGSKYFSNAAVTPESRALFIRSVLDTFIAPFPGVFDGIDLDWEYPVRGGPAGMVSRPEDRENLTNLIVELRRSYNGLITIAAPAGSGHLVKYEMKRLAELLDFINVMTYDFHTAGSRIAHFNSPLGSAPDDPSPDYNIEKSLAAFIAEGVPRDKLVVGAPFYGYGYAHVPAINNGRFQPVTRPDTTGIGRPKWTGAVRYYSIADVMKDGFIRHWDDHAQVPWLYNPATQTFITYDDPQSLSAKAAFVRENKLGGIMIWELSGDDGTLLPAIVNSLKQ